MQPGSKETGEIEGRQASAGRSASSGASECAQRLGAGKIWAAGALLAVSTLATSQPDGTQASGSPISTDRGTAFSNSSSIVPLGRWQIEAGYTLSRAGGSTLQTFGELALRFPIGPKLELRLTNLSLSRVPGAFGLSDPAAGLKYQLVQGGNRRPEVSVIVQASVPVGAAAFGVRRWQPSVQLPWSIQLDAMTGLGGMLSVADVGPYGARFTQYGAGGYLSRSLGSRISGYLELYALGPMGNGGPNSAFVDLCLTFLSRHDTQFDIRFGTGINRTRDGWFIGFGVGYRF